MLRLQREQLEFLEGQIAELDIRIQEHISGYQQAVDLCLTIPGIEKVAAANLIAEIGVNMDQFPSAQHLASWAGLCPGNNESAGKRLSGKARNGSVWLRRNLCQAAWAASHSKNTYLSAQFRRLAARKGKKRAIVAVAHTILVIVFHMLKNQQPYRDLGPDYFDRRNADQLKRSLVRRRERLGVQVSIVSAAPARQSVALAGRRARARLRALRNWSWRAESDGLGTFRQLGGPSALRLRAHIVLLAHALSGVHAAAGYPSPAELHGACLPLFWRRDGMHPHRPHENRAHR